MRPHILSLLAVTVGALACSGDDGNEPDPPQTTGDTAETRTDGRWHCLPTGHRPWIHAGMRRLQLQRLRAMQRVTDRMSPGRLHYMHK